MTRTEVIQKILDKKKARTYLEIGVSMGKNFFPIKARQKIAVDPHFGFSKEQKLLWFIKNPYNIIAKYYEITSDRYFAEKDSYQPDVAFIDGLHTYKQSLQDFNNALLHLKEDGVIVMHDCNPPNEAAAHPADSLSHASSMNLPGWTGLWTGDVWKTICYIRSQRKDMKAFVLDCESGLGVITRGENDNPLTLSEQEIDKMTYKDLEQNRKDLLDLKDESFVPEFIKTL